MTASSQPRAFSQTIASVTGDAGDSRYGDTRRRKTLHAISSTNTLHAISSTNTLHAISSTNTSNRSRSDSSRVSAGTRVYRACAHKVSCTCGDTGEADWATHSFDPHAFIRTHVFIRITHIHSHHTHSFASHAFIRIARIHSYHTHSFVSYAFASHAFIRTTRIHSHSRITIMACSTFPVGLVFE
jgi:hypothetical protein